MRVRVVLIAVLIVAAGCGDRSTSVSSITTTTGTAPASEADRLEVMGLAVRAVATDYNTFGSDFRFDELLLQTHIDPAAGGDQNGFGLPPGRELTAAERAAVEDALGGVGRSRWIDDPAQYRTEDLMPTIAGSAIIGVGEVVFDDDGALVPVSLWCGGTCGFWAQLRVAWQDGAWSVTGPEGPMMIS
jgi:hypothetical protein